MSNCIFCKIISGQEPTDIIYQDEDVVIIKDIKPAAKFHYLAIPKIHIKDVKALTVEHRKLIENLIDLGKMVLKDNGCNVEDLRIGFHVPPFNSISHLHLHLIAPVSEMNFLSRMIFKPNTWWFATADFILENLSS
ncbi:hypothetical protein RN001_009833 [Aquatica leii]|uniref:Adenosine 5'-monophosphoramidase HINT3 n=1 Tax=Aquatica leii TaxID=1421715 RepID=A0AAN7PVS3_9COLE|nr:hypothetical protein RN001_009833 [Aquatica leii]